MIGQKKNNYYHTVTLRKVCQTIAPIALGVGIDGIGNGLMMIKIKL